MFGEKKKYPFNHGKNVHGKVYAGPPVAVYAGPPRDPRAEEPEVVIDVYNGPPVDEEHISDGDGAGGVPCKACGKINDASRPFCEDCGTPLKKDGA